MLPDAFRASTNALNAPAACASLEQPASYFSLPSSSFIRHSSFWLATHFYSIALGGFFESFRNTCHRCIDDLRADFWLEISRQNWKLPCRRKFRQNFAVNSARKRENRWKSSTRHFFPEKKKAPPTRTKGDRGNTSGSFYRLFVRVIVPRVRTRRASTRHACTRVRSTVAICICERRYVNERSRSHAAATAVLNNTRRARRVRPIGAPVEICCDTSRLFLASCLHSGSFRLEFCFWQKKKGSRISNTAVE